MLGLQPVLRVTPQGGCKEAAHLQKRPQLLPGQLQLLQQVKAVESFQCHSLERPPLSQLSHSIHVKGVPLFQLHQDSCQADLGSSVNLRNQRNDPYLHIRLVHLLLGASKRQRYIHCVAVDIRLRHTRCSNIMDRDACR